MKKVNEVFFGEHGLTSTSANHLANIAQEKIVSNEAKLKNLNFVTTTVDIVGSPENSGKIINKGYDETRLSEVRGLLSEIADINAFCAWIREAIKAKETELNDATTKSYEDWLKENSLENDRPEFVGDATNDDVMAEMTVKERNEYFHLEATAATIGKYRELNAKFKEWKIKECERISQLKIVIPMELQPIYDALCELEK